MHYRLAVLFVCLNMPYDPVFCRYLQHFWSDVKNNFTIELANFFMSDILDEMNFGAFQCVLYAWICPWTQLSGNISAIFGWF